MIKSIIIAVVVALLAPYGARAQGVPELECSCSPKTFQFIISLDISLDPFCTQKNDIVSNTGILDATTRCSFAVVRVIPESISEGDGIKEEESIMFEELQPDFAVQNITSIEFKESNEDGDEIRKTTLNYGTPLPLEDGDKVDLVSVSSALDPSLSLEDQMGKVPYSVEIRLYGYNAEDELIINIIRWTYDLSCGSDPIQTGDTIGWITIVSSNYVADVMCVLLALQPTLSNQNSASIRANLKGHGHNSARQYHHR
jgi:hypothetical protein